jgi:DNA-binding transcriptional regulator YiaG
MERKVINAMEAERQSRQFRNEEQARFADMEARGNAKVAGMTEITEVAELRKAVGMNLTQFSKFTGIPYRTLQNWESNTSQCPHYIISLMETCVKHKEVWYSENYLTSYARTKKR